MIEREHFKLGMGKLAAAFPDKSLGPKDVAARLLVYFEALGARMSAQEWSAAVERSILEGTFFPRVSELLDHAIASRRSSIVEIPRLTDAEREAAREEARRGLEMIRARVKALATPPPVKALPPPKPETVVDLSEHDERIRMLKRQAAEMLGQVVEVK